MLNCLHYLIFDNNKKVDMIFPIQKNLHGSYVNAREKVSNMLRKFLHSGKSVMNNSFQILLCGDGTMISKTGFNVVNFSFNILNRKDYSHNGQFTLVKLILYKI
jgi:hypothetical protein